MDAYRLDEGRFINTVQVTSAADALFVAAGVTPGDGKVWTVLQADYHPSAAETREIAWYVLNARSSVAHYLHHESWAFTGFGRNALVHESNELKLWPGDELRVQRVAATAGSTMSLRFRYIESDIPLHEYRDVQEDRRAKSGHFVPRWRELARSDRGGMSSGPSGHGGPGGAGGSRTGGGGGGGAPAK